MIDTYIILNNQPFLSGDLQTIEPLLFAFFVVVSLKESKLMFIEVTQVPDIWLGHSVFVVVVVTLISAKKPVSLYGYYRYYYSTCKNDGKKA